MDKFYEIVTGERDSFKQLCEVLPSVLEDVISSKEDASMQNTVFKELKAISPNLLHSLYKLSFSKYEGFGDLQL
jgi:hypothetical protein